MVSKYKRLPMPHDVIENKQEFVMVWALNNSLLVKTSFHTALSIMSSQALELCHAIGPRLGGLHATLVHDTSLAIINDDGFEFLPLEWSCFPPLLNSSY